MDSSKASYNFSLGSEHIMSRFTSGDMFSSHLHLQGTKQWVWGTFLLREQHWNMYIIWGETDHQPRLDAWDKRSDLVHWEGLEGAGGEGGGRGDWDGEHM